MVQHPKTIKFDFGSTEFLVEGIWNRGYPGSREEPPEPAGWEIQKIALAELPTINLVDAVSDLVIEAATDALDEVQALEEDRHYEERERRDEEIDDDA